MQCLSLHDIRVTYGGRHAIQSVSEVLITHENSTNQVSGVWFGSAIGQKLTISSKEIENLSKFVSFGSLLACDDNYRKQISKKMEKAVAVTAQCRTICKSKHNRVAC